LVIRGVIGRGWGQGAQHSKSLHGMFAHIPGLRVIMPTTPQDAYSLLRASIRDPNPVIFLEHRWLYDISGPVDFNLEDELGKAVVRRKGTDITLVATSWMNVEALKAAEVLEKIGISAEIVDVRSISPYDGKTVTESVRKTGRAVVIDYDWGFAGFGAEVSSQIYETCFAALKAPVHRLGFEHVPCPTTRPLENEFFPNCREYVWKRTL
jgi:acetoin:2,6-dichlorophenolindophenol oxidoreductase subunit beta